MAIQSDHEFAPTQIARAVFPTAFRGYDQDAVRRYLSRLAAALEHQQEYAGLGELEARTPAHERVEQLEAEAESLREEIKDLELELVQRSVKGDPSGSGGEDGSGAGFDEHRAIEFLGQETARVLESARSAAADILKRAETHAASLNAQARAELADAEQKAQTMTSERQAETHKLVKRLTADADAQAERVTTEADEHRMAVLKESKKILAEAEALAAAEHAEAEKRAKQIVADAETLRQQVISELVVERRDAQGEMNRMNAARDRLAMSLSVARSELDEIADALAEVSTMHLSTGQFAADFAEANPLDLVSDSGFGARTRSDSDSESEPDADAKSVAGAGSVSEAKSEAGSDGLIDDAESGVVAGELDLRTDGEPGGDGEEMAGDDEPSGSAAGTKASPAKTGGPKSGVAKSGGANASRTKADDAKATGAKAAGAKSAVAKTSGPKSAAAKSGAAKTDRAKPGGVVSRGAKSSVDVIDRAAEGDHIDLDTDAEPVVESDVAEGRDGDPGHRADDTEEFDADFELDTELDIDPDLTGLIDDMTNKLPTDGGALSLVEGFTTIDLTGDEGIDRQEDRNAVDDAGPAEPPTRAAGDATTSYAGTPGRESTGGSERTSGRRPDRPAPDDVITTVASRTATSQPDRTRGDLLVDETFTGRLPKEFAARDLALARSGPNFRRQLRRALNDDQSEVLDRLRGGRGEVKVDELPAFADQIDRYLAPLRRGLAEIAQAGAKAGGRSDLSQPALDNLVRQLARYIVDKVRIPTIQVLQETTDHDRERILEPIRALYRDFRNIGLSDLTEDALYEAFAIGLYDAIQPGAAVRWVVDPRSDPDPVCEINRRRDDLAKGDVFPSGHSRPLSLPGCRCLVNVPGR